MPRGRALRNNLHVWYDAPLPPLPELYCGIYIRENTPAIEELADYLDADLRADPPDEEFQHCDTPVAAMRASGTSH